MTSEILQSVAIMLAAIAGLLNTYEISKLQKDKNNK